MKIKFAKVTKAEKEKYILPFIPKNKRGFVPKVDLVDVIQCILQTQNRNSMELFIR